MELRIASWNVHGTESSWAFLERLVEHNRIQVFLLQEARLPTATPSGWRIYPPLTRPAQWRLSVPAGLQRNYCSAVVVTDPTLRFSAYEPVPLHEESDRKLAASHPGQYAAAEIGLDGGTSALTVISLYGIWEKMAEDDSDDIYADATLHRALSDLSHLFGRRNDPKIVLAGDLNIWHQYDSSNTLRNWDSTWAARFESVFTRLRALGMELLGPFRHDDEPRLDRCPCGSDACRHVNTYRHQRRPTATPYQNDYVFASIALHADPGKCFAVMDDDVWEHSDHRPLVAVVDV